MAHSFSATQRSASLWSWEPRRPANSESTTVSRSRTSSTPPWSGEALVCYEGPVRPSSNEHLHRLVRHTLDCHARGRQGNLRCGFSSVLHRDACHHAACLKLAFVAHE